MVCYECDSVKKPNIKECVSTIPITEIDGQAFERLGKKVFPEWWHTPNTSTTSIWFLTDGTFCHNSKKQSKIELQKEIQEWNRQMALGISKITCISAVMRIHNHNFNVCECGVNENYGFNTTQDERYKIVITSRATGNKYHYCSINGINNKTDFSYYTYEPDTKATPLTKEEVGKVISESLQYSWFTDSSYTLAILPFSEHKHKYNKCVCGVKDP